MCTRQVMPVSILRDQVLVQFLYWLHASRRGSLNAVIHEEALCHERSPHIRAVLPSIVNVQIEASLKTMTKVWMGWQDFSAAVRCGDLQIERPREFTRSASTWLGLSSLSGVRKQPPDLRVMRPAATIAQH